MTQEQTDSGSNWLTNYPRYPSKITGILIVALVVAALAAGTADLWDPSDTSVALGLFAVGSGLWVVLYCRTEAMIYSAGRRPRRRVSNVLSDSI